MLIQIEFLNLLKGIVWDNFRIAIWQRIDTLSFDEELEEKRLPNNTKQHSYIIKLLKWWLNVETMCAVKLFETYVGKKIEKNASKTGNTKKSIGRKSSKKWVQVLQLKHFDLLKPLRLSRVIRRGQNGGNFVQDF